MVSKSNISRYIDQSILQTKKGRDLSDNTPNMAKFRNMTNNEDFSGKVVI